MVKHVRFWESLVDIDKNLKYYVIRIFDLICQLPIKHFVLSSGIGPKRAIDLIKQYKTIEEIVKHIDTKVIHYTGLYREDALHTS